MGGYQKSKGSDSPPLKLRRRTVEVERSVSASVMAERAQVYAATCATDPFSPANRFERGRPALVGSTRSRPATASPFSPRRPA